MFLLVVVLCLAGPVLSQGTSSPVYRLPSTITPLNYMIRLEPDVDNSVVNGAIMMELQTTSDTSVTLTSITMHLGLDAAVDETSVMLLDSSGVQVTIGAIKYDDDNTLVTVALPTGDTLSFNHIYMLSIQFQSLIYSEQKGFFMGSYNSTSKYLASYFRPTYARDAFPCFDEPQFKVPVTLQVLRPASYIAVSTAPLFSSTTESNNSVLDTFNTTNAISIHSLGLFISQITPVTTMGVQLYAPSDFPTSVNYLENILYNLSSTLGDFPVLPLNLVVLPDRLLTSFSSYSFVFTSPEVYKGSVASAVKWPNLKLELTEAFVRQYVEFAKTPQWWSDLWLSESVGAYLATTFQPETLYHDWLRIEIRSQALGADFSDTNSAVVNDDLLARSDIENAIANQTIKIKGLSVLTMWTDTMAEGLVTETILEYIKLSKTVVTTEDLVAIMAANILADKTYNVSAAIPLLAFWLNSTGYPIVTYAPQTSTAFTLTQNDGCNSDTISPVWPVSVSYAQNSSQNWDDLRRGLWLLDPAASFTAADSLDPWTIFNLETAPFRVDYSTKWEEAISVLTSGSAPDTVNSMLQDDVVALSLSGCVTFSIALSALTAAQRDQFDWWPVVKAFDVFTAKMGGNTLATEAFAMYADTVFTSDELQALALTNTSSSIKYARVLLTPWLCQFNISTCRQDAVALRSQLLQGSTSAIDPNDLENVMCLGSRYGAPELDTLMSGYAGASDLWTKHLYTVGIGCVTDPDSVKTILEVVSNGTLLTTSDATKVLIGLAGSVDNSEALVNFLLDDPYNLQSMYGVESLTSVIKSMAKFNVDLSQLEALANSSLGLNLAVGQAALETVAETSNIAAWWTTYGTVLLSILPQVPATPSAPPIVTPTAPSSAVSLINAQVLMLIVAAGAMILSTSL